MSGFLRIPESTNLAFHALCYLASNPGTLATIGAIATYLHASEAHLSKVLQAMRKGGFVDATRGPSGGYTLRKAPHEISLLEIHEALQGKHTSHQCLLKAPVCRRQSCSLGKFAQRLDDEFKQFLSETTLGAFMDSSR
jgi:Rrf2 family protein